MKLAYVFAFVLCEVFAWKRAVLYSDKEIEGTMCFLPWLLYSIAMMLAEKQRAVGMFCEEDASCVVYLCETIPVNKLCSMLLDECEVLCYTLLLLELVCEAAMKPVML